MEGGLQVCHRRELAAAGSVLLLPIALGVQACDPGTLLVMRELIVHLTFISTLCTTTHHLVPPHITWFGVSPGDSDLPGTCDEFVFRLSSCFQFGQSLALRSGHSRDSICRDTFALVEFLIRLFDPEQEYLCTVIPSTW